MHRYEARLSSSWFYSARNACIGSSEAGNQFRYIAAADIDNAGRKDDRSYDVFLVTIYPARVEWDVEIVDIQGVSVSV